MNNQPTPAELSNQAARGAKITKKQMADAVKTLDQPQMVTNITLDQGIGIAMQGEAIEDTSLEFLQHYGSRENCELFDDDVCSHDELLWGADDFGSPLFCTMHAFPQEQLGYEFVSMVAYVNRPVATEFEIEQNSDGQYFCTLVDYYQGSKPATHTRLPQVWKTYQEAHTYGFWWIEQSKLPISEGFKISSLEAALAAAK